MIKEIEKYYEKAIKDTMKLVPIGVVVLVFNMTVMVADIVFGNYIMAALSLTGTLFVVLSSLKAYGDLKRLNEEYEKYKKK